MITQALSEDVHAEVVKTFKIFDVDDSKLIDKEEALKHW